MTPLVVLLALTMGGVTAAPSPVVPVRSSSDGCDTDEEGCNKHGNDCNNNSGECSDDDQVQIGPICVEPGSCRFG